MDTVKNVIKILIQSKALSLVNKLNVLISLENKTLDRLVKSIVTILGTLAVFKYL